MSSSNAFINNFVLFKSFLNSSVNKLSHLKVVGEHINWQVFGLGNRYKFFLIIVVVSVLLVWNVNIVFIDCSWTFECSKWLNVLFQFVILLNIFHHYSTILPVEKFTEIKCMRYRRVILQLMKKEGVIMFMQKSQELVSVLVILHVVKMNIVGRELLNENLWALTH